MELKMGDRVCHKYYKWKGTVIRVWDGKYQTDYYEGEQFNPYRIQVIVDGNPEGSPAFYYKFEDLEVLPSPE